MALWVCIGLTVATLFYAKLTKKSEPFTMMFCILLLCAMVLLTAAMISSAFTDDRVDTWNMDGNTIHNESYGGTNHYWTMVEGGQKMLLPSMERERDKFIPSDENTIKHICETTPDWLLPFDFGPCHWEIRAEYVE